MLSSVVWAERAALRFSAVTCNTRQHIADRPNIPFFPGSLPLFISLVSVAAFNVQPGCILVWWPGYVSTQPQMCHILFIIYIYFFIIYLYIFFFFISGRPAGWDMPQTAPMCPVIILLVNVLRSNWNVINALFSSSSGGEAWVCACMCTRSSPATAKQLSSAPEHKEPGEMRDKKKISPLWQNRVLHQPLLFCYVPVRQCIQLFTLRPLSVPRVTVLTDIAVYWSTDCVGIHSNNESR